MSYQIEAREIMFRANHSLTPPNTQYMMENLKSVSGVGYGHKDYSSRIHDLFRKDGLAERLQGNYTKDPEREALTPKLSNLILYRSAMNPGKN